MKHTRMDIRALDSGLAIASEERSLAGAIRAVLAGIGGLTLALLLLLPGVTHAHAGRVLAIAAIGAEWGLCAGRLIDWAKAPALMLYMSIAAGLVLIGLAIASSGGVYSPAWIYLFFVAVFAAYFLAPGVAAVFLAACIATQATALLYDPRAADEGYIAQLVIATTAYVVLGGSIAIGRRRARCVRSASRTSRG